MWFKLSQLFVAFILFFSVGCQAQDAWHGEYFYEAVLGQNVVQSAVVLQYTIILSESGCRIVILGYQTNEDIVCSKTENSTGVDLAFQSYQDGKISNIYDVQVYEVGDVLLSLDRPKKGIITTWGALLPDENMPRSGLFFTRTQ